MRETWYVLEDGRLADPAEVSTDEDGRLVHASGVLVEMKGDVPRSRGCDYPDEARAKAKADAEKGSGSDKKDMKPDEPKRGYKTRESKAD